MFLRKTVVLFAGVSLLAGILSTQSGASTQTQDQPYAGQEKRSIKSLSEFDIESLKNGHGMGLAKAVELNHYPGPKHVLELASELSLSEKQKTSAQNIFDEMKAQAISLGIKIITAETELDSLCLNGEITEIVLKQQTAHIGDLQSKLRFTHMVAHLKMKAVLSEKQVALYDQLRGYR